MSGKWDFLPTMAETMKRPKLWDGDLAKTDDGESYFAYFGGRWLSESEMAAINAEIVCRAKGRNAGENDARR